MAYQKAYGSLLITELPRSKVFSIYGFSKREIRSQSLADHRNHRFLISQKAIKPVFGESVLYFGKCVLTAREAIFVVLSC